MCTCQLEDSDPFRKNYFESGRWFLQDVFVHTHLDPVYLVGGRNISTACAMFGRHVSAFAAVGRFLFFFWIAANTLLVKQLSRWKCYKIM